MDEKLVVVFDTMQRRIFDSIYLATYHPDLSKLFHSLESQLDYYVADLSFDEFCNLIVALQHELKADSRIIDRLVELGEVQQLDFKRCLESHTKTRKASLGIIEHPRK